MPKWGKVDRLPSSLDCSLQIVQVAKPLKSMGEVCMKTSESVGSIGMLRRDQVYRLSSSLEGSFKIGQVAKAAITIGEGRSKTIQSVGYSNNIQFRWRRG
jgi:hypothetical protein